MYFLIGRSNSFMNMYVYIDIWIRIQCRGLRDFCCIYIARRTLVVVGLHYDVADDYEDDKDYEDRVA